MILRNIFILSWIGLLVSGYLAYQYAIPSTFVCPIFEGGCEAVKNSVYNQILGVPMPFLGVAFYLFAALMSIILMERKDNLFKIMFLISALSAFLFSAYLTYLEAFVIKAYCFWCLVSATIATFIFALTLKFHQQKEEQKNEN